MPALGDRAAFATLYERTSSHLFAVVLRINRDRAQAEDILQEVYVNVWRAAQSFDAAQSQPLTWLTSIARNRAIDSLRREQTQPQIAAPGAAAGGTDAEDEDVYDTVADAAPGPLDLLSRAAGCARARRRAWTSSRRAAAAERRARRSTRASATPRSPTQLRQPLGTVKSWVRRAAATLKSCLQGAVHPRRRQRG